MTFSSKSTPRQGAKKFSKFVTLSVSLKLTLVNKRLLRMNTALPGRQRQYFPFQGHNSEPSTPNISKFVVWRHKNSNSGLSLDRCQTLPTINYKTKLIK